MARNEPPYKVGALAQLAGVSVRTLHHYEAIGLLTPSARTRSIIGCTRARMSIAC